MTRRKETAELISRNQTRAPITQSEQARRLSIWAELEKEQAEQDEYQPRKRSICDFWHGSAGRR
jgi:hypothetical protein